MRATIGVPAIKNDEFCNGIYKVLGKAIQAFSQSDEEEIAWTSRLKGDFTEREDALLALLLPALANLQRLDLVVDDGESPCFTEMLDRIGQNARPFATQPALIALTEIFTTNDEDKYGMDCSIIAPYFLLPSLRRLYGHKIGSSDDDHHPALAALKSGASSLTHLELRYCMINSPDIISMVHACKALKTFIYERGYGHLSYSNFSTTAVRKALVPTETSLESLWLDCCPGTTYCNDSDDFAAITSFARFRTLKHLRVGLLILLGAHFNSSGNEEYDLDEENYWDENFIIDQGPCRLVDMLPSTLETLYLTRCNGRISLMLIHLEKLLELKSERTPHLKKITFETAFDLKPYSFSRLDALAEKVGVDLCKIDTSCPVGEWVDRGWGMDEDIFWALGLDGINQGPVQGC